ncbi:GNAT family N-acetyltransferase [Shewanella violacea]|uniref:Acetyltransferase, GNAT family n=1 Tax=Shewanella violacea (strain JCM 10179 / CIP 106290 / LMG 19151 / DSS12) TaxID=637905 RepID=D4ZLL2_SHEVD|nr:GNAT family N-acetyltransferase [Shewanella violacea]BAJ02561.1 acetyltransferase, GNAT family [Shewanella violacea DSS12]
MTWTTKQISIRQLDDLVHLFEQYMVFYGKPSQPQKFRDYLQQRLSRDEAHVYVAYDPDNRPLGFVLNYLSFSSVSLGKVVVLNDLFVVESHRKKGIANQLIHCSIGLALELNAIRVDLATAQDNYGAQSLYEKLGFIRDTQFFSYSLST